MSAKVQGPIVQSVNSLTSSLVVKLLTVLVSKIFNLQIFLLKKCEWLLQMQKRHIFLAKILAYMPYLIIKVLTFYTLTNNIVSFEQLGPGFLVFYCTLYFYRLADIYDGYGPFRIQRTASRKHAYIILTPFNPTVI